MGYYSVRKTDGDGASHLCTQQRERLQHYKRFLNGLIMYHHVKKLMYLVDINNSDPRFGKMLLEQFDDAALADPLIAVVGEGGVSLNNSQGVPGTSANIAITGQPEVDLRTSMAAEARAKIAYERLRDDTDDPRKTGAEWELLKHPALNKVSFQL
tara:strand:- start:2599 stop:3063 length:465 start_codon:yes stop_codon:yes gene_type:complete